MRSNILLLLATAAICTAQPSHITFQSTQSQAVLSYQAPDSAPCTIQVADMNRGIVIASASQAAGVVTVNTTIPHGLPTGAVAYLENSGVSAWNGFQNLTAVPSPTSFQFASATSGTSSAGSAGALIDDVNSSIYPGSNSDSRAGNITSGNFRQFVLGLHDSPVAADGNRYSRALQVASRHVYTLTCAGGSITASFTTANAPVGATLGAVPPVDSNHQYGYPTVQWANQAQSLIDPVSGYRSVRTSVVSDVPAGSTAFTNAFDVDPTSWTNPTGPLTTGTATFTSPCAGSNCFLFLRATNLIVGKGATFTDDTSSALDWVQVTVTGAKMLSACSGADCVIQACLTLNGVTCTTPFQNRPLTTAAGTVIFGTTTPMDLWQVSGAPQIASPDVSLASGTVAVSGSVVTWTGGYKFNVHWTAGSRITIAGTEYVIASMQSEVKLTVLGSPSAGAYSGNNFGVLIKKQTSTVNTMSVGPATFNYGTSSFTNWNSLSTNTCSTSTTPNAAGQPGYNCVVTTNPSEMFWIAADGSAVNDMGVEQTAFVSSGFPDPFQSTPGPQFQGASPWGNVPCGSSGTPSLFDPLDADTFYCVLPAALPNDNFQTYWIVKTQYIGDHRQGTPGLAIPGCDVDDHFTYHPNFLSGQCLRFTIMMPNTTDRLTNGPSGYNNSGPGIFNPAYATWPLAQATAGWFMAGISSDSMMRVFTRGDAGQGSAGWFAIYDLGNRNPVGSPGGMKIVGMGNSFSHYPDRWCAIHAVGIPTPGVMNFGGDPLSASGGTTPYGFYGLTVGAIPGTASACPANPYGVTGNNCSSVVLSTNMPTRPHDGSTLVPIDPGDIFRAGTSATGDLEYFRVLLAIDSTHYVVSRGYASNVFPHADGSTFEMECGQLSPITSQNGYWNFAADPFGTNPTGDTVFADENAPGGHIGGNDSMQIGSGGGGYTIGQNLCPDAYFTGNIAACYVLRQSVGLAILAAPLIGVSNGPKFNGIIGAGGPNAVDSHPGFCIGMSWCVDARPNLGWGVGNDTVGQLVAVDEGGGIWHFTVNSNQTLHRKLLPTVAYSGRVPLVDLSGPGSSIASTINAYCVALLAGECKEGSAVGDVYANAPLTSAGSCLFPGVAIPTDDRGALCIFDALLSGNAWQIGVTGQNMTGNRNRSAGNLFSRWSQDGVFWNVIGPPTGTAMFSMVRWLEGIDNQSIITYLPAYPQPDGSQRSTYQSVTVQIPRPVNGSATNAVVEFGYSDFGPAASFYCSGRLESCVAANSADSANPWYYENSEAYSGVPCASGCTVSIPVLPNHVVYYRVKLRDAGGAALVTGPAAVAVV